MTILLIDQGGHKREMEIRPSLHDYGVVLVPVPGPITLFAHREPIQVSRRQAVRFERSAELSYPPVYRWAGWE